MNKVEILETKQELLEKKALIENDLINLERKLETIKYNEEDEIRRKDSVKNKTKLSELTCNDSVFKVSYTYWRGEVTWAGYVDVAQCEPDKDGGYSFGVSHKTRPEGFSSWFNDKYADKHCLLMDFSSSLYFITMKPETWEEDMKASLHEYIKIKEERFNKEIKKFKEQNKKMLNSYKEYIKKNENEK
jgi:hypothetical protein